MWTENICSININSMSIFAYLLSVLHTSNGHNMCQEIKGLHSRILRCMSFDHKDWPLVVTSTESQQNLFIISFRVIQNILVE